MGAFNIRKRHAKPLRVAAFILLLGIGIGSYYAYTLYQYIFSPNIAGHTPAIVYIRPGVTVEDLKDTLDKYTVLKTFNGFDWVAKQMSFTGAVKPGRYVLRPGMHNRAIIGLFRSGAQEAILLPIVKKRTLPDLAEYIAERLMLSAEPLKEAFQQEVLLDSLGVTREQVLGLFLTDSYKLYWTASAEEVLVRMKQEYDAYWTPARVQQAANKGLTPMEAVILASIVEEETAQEPEKARVAGLYLNRLDKGWKLQADPTVKYAVGDFTLRRVLYKHLETPSPYNTYLHEGLPPGPICIPFKSTIEAVLNAEDHDYLYMCAKADFSGYHNFARTARQHAINKQAYTRALNQRSIYQ